MRPIGSSALTRLVEQDDGRPADEGLGDAEPLAHPTRVGRRSAVGRIGDADPAEKSVDALFAVAVVSPEARDVAERLAAGHPAVEPRVLGEVAELAAMLAGSRDGNAVDRRAAGRCAARARQGS